MPSLLTHSHISDREMFFLSLRELCANNNYVDYNKEATFALFNLLLSVLLLKFGLLSAFSSFLFLLLRA